MGGRAGARDPRNRPDSGRNSVQNRGPVFVRGPYFFLELILTPKPIHILKALEKGFSDMYGSWGDRCPQKRVMEARRSAILEFWVISGKIGDVFLVHGRTVPTTQTCSVNNFSVTSAFLNLNSSRESRDQELQNDPFSIFMIGASSMVKISSQNGPHGQDLPFRCARARGRGRNLDF